MENKTLQTVFSAALAAFAIYFNMLAVPISVLIIMIIIDYVTGMAAAYVNAELSSRKGIKGIIKKISYMALIAVSMGVDYLIYNGMCQIGINVNYTIFFGILVTIWLIINELISILENLVKLEVPIPKFLIKIINKLKVTVEKESEDK